MPRPNSQVWSGHKTKPEINYYLWILIILEIQCIPNKFVELLDVTVCGPISCLYNSAIKHSRNKVAVLSSTSLLLSAKSSVWKC